MKLEFTKFGEHIKDMYWLTSVLSQKDDLRSHAHTVLIKDDFAYKTDGNRMFRVHNDSDEKWTDGVYDVLKRTKSAVMLFKREEETIWPDCEAFFVDTSDSYRDFRFSEATINTDIKDLFGLVRETECTFNVQWLIDLVANDGEFVGHLMNKECDSALILENGCKTALIMPKRA